VIAIDILAPRAIPSNLPEIEAKPLIEKLFVNLHLSNTR